MIASVLGTLMLLAAAGVTLALAAATGFFAGPRLQGPDTMGYASVFMGLAMRWALTVVAALIALSRGSFDWISSKPGMPTVIVLAGLVGLGIVFGLAWIQWTAPPEWYTIPAGNLGALVLPLMLQGYLLVALWVKPEALNASTWPRAIGYPLSIIGAAGLITGGVVFFHAQVQRARREQAAFEQEREEDERNRLDNEARLAGHDAQLDALSNVEPLEKFLPHLFIDKSDAHQHRALGRMRVLPNLTAQIDRALSVPDPMDREYAANFIRMCDNPDVEWAPIVARALSLLARAVAAAPALYDQVTMRSYRGMILGMLLTARRFPGTDFSKEVGELNQALLAKPEDETRQLCLGLLDAFAKGATLS
jgi:hypothetical protein